MQLQIFQADAFTDRLFGGNPAAVIPLENWLPDSLMQAIGAENNLSETAFFVKKGTDFHLRWFTPALEVDLCGHATIATAHVLWQHLGYEGDQILFDSKSGMLGVKKDGDFYILDFPTDKLEKIEAPALVFEAFGVQPLEVFQGREDFLIVVESQEVVENLQPDFRKLSQMGGRGAIVTAPGRDVDFVSRCFFPCFGIDEDPVTGSAHTTLTPYWAARLGKNELTARQISKRVGFIKCRLLGERTEISGQAVTFLKGTIEV